MHRTAAPGPNLLKDKIQGRVGGDDRAVSTVGIPNQE